MHLILAGTVLVFGAATLILHDVRFLQWKASVFYWLAGLLFAGTVWVGKMTLLERMMGKALPEGTSVPATAWRNTSLIMGAVYLLLGTVNIWVAVNRSDAGLGHLQSVDRAARGDRDHRRGAALDPARRAVREGTDGVTAARVELLRAALEAALHPTLLEIRDDSARHAGHAGAREGGHFHVVIAAPGFAGARNWSGTGWSMLPPLN